MISQLKRDRKIEREKKEGRETRNIIYCKIKKNINLYHIYLNIQTEYDEEELVHVEELDELFEKLVDNGMYSIGVAKDWQEGREIEVKSERDEEIDSYVQD